MAKEIMLAFSPRGHPRSKHAGPVPPSTSRSLPISVSLQGSLSHSLAKKDAHRDLISKLPKLVALEALGFLELQDIIKFHMVSKAYSAMCDAYLWTISNFDARLYSMNGPQTRPLFRAWLKKARQIKAMIFDNQDASNEDILLATTAYKSLQHLSLENCTNVDDLSLQHLAQYCTALQFLDLEGCLHVTPVGLEVLLRATSSLLCVYLNGLPNVDDSVLGVIGQNCHNLLSFGAEKCVLITDDGVRDLANGCHGLREVCFTECVNISAEAISSIARNCTELTLVGFEGCPQVTDSALTALAQNCRNIEVLGAESCFQVTDIGVCIAAQAFSNLRFLSLDFCMEITDVSLQMLAMHSKNLAELFINGCFDVTDFGVSALAAGCKKLTALGIEECPNITDESLTQIGTHLKHLKILGLNSDSAITDVGVIALARGCPVLHTLYINHCHISDFAIIELANRSKSITTIGLNGCPYVTDEGVGALARYRGASMQEIFVVLAHGVKGRYFHLFSQSCRIVSHLSEEEIEQTRSANISTPQALPISPVA